MIQKSVFHDGGFVLHKIMVNGHKYSAWYSPDGSVKDAERVSRDNQTTYSVPSRHRNVWAELERTGQCYAAFSTVFTHSDD